MEQKIEINKSEFALDLLARFSELKKSNKYCDFIIRTGKEEIPVHRFVLAANSEYFDAMLSHDTKENAEGVVEIKEVDPECVVKCVDFMYSGEAVVSLQKQRDLMHVAHMLRLHRLYKGIATFLKSGLDFSTFFPTREIARVYDCDNLLETCNEFAVKNFEAIATFEDFKKLELGCLKLFLSSNVQNEKNTIKLKALLMWINHDSERISALHDMLKLIELRNVSLSYRRYVTENEPAVSASNECLREIVRSVYDDSHVEAADVTLKCRFSQANYTHVVMLDYQTETLKSFDPRQKTWSDMHKMHKEMVNTFSSAVSMDEYLYVFLNTKTFRINYREHDAEWKQLADSTTDGMMVVALNGIIYGKHHGNFSERVECFDPKKNLWNFILDSNYKTVYSAMGTLDPQETLRSAMLVIIGGQDETNKSSDIVAQFNPCTSSWSDSPSLRVRRFQACATTLNSVMYVFGGYDGSRWVTDSAEIWYPNTDSWQIIQLNNLPRASCLSSFAINDKIYIVGSSGRRRLSNITKYNPATEEFELFVNFTDTSLFGYYTAALTI